MKVMDHEHGNCADWFEIICKHLDGELDPDRREFLCEHLEKCPACVAFIQSLESTRDSLGRLRAQPEPEKTKAMMRECLDEVLRVLDKG